MTRERNIAIITRQALQGFGLQNILTDYFALANSKIYECNEAFSFPLVDKFDFYFVDADIAMQAFDFFIPRKARVVLIIDQNFSAQKNSFLCLNINQGLTSIIDQLHDITEDLLKSDEQEQNTLSNREIDVLKLIIKGHINKEIADLLNISLNTVLTHRKNITSKLGIKTVSGLTFYAMMNGYAD